MEQIDGLAIQNAAHEGQTFTERAKQVEALVIMNAEQEKGILDFLAEVKTNYKKFDDARKFFTAPLNQQVDAINAKFMPFLKNLKDIEANLKLKVSAWRTSEEVRRIENERKMLESQARSAVAEGNVEQLQQLQPQHEALVNQAPKRVETENGSVTFREKYVWTVEDITKVPSGFTKVVIDDERLDEVVKNTKGLMPIPGIKIEVQKIPIVRT